MPRKTTDSNAQNRESQRRSRARRRELIVDLSRKLDEYKRRGVAASLEMQTAARAVVAENQRLRALLSLHGVSQGDIDQYLASPGHAASETPKTGPINHKYTSQKRALSPSERTGSMTLAHNMLDTRPPCEDSSSSIVTRSISIAAAGRRISVPTSEIVPPRQGRIAPATGLSLDETRSHLQHDGGECCRGSDHDNHRNLEQIRYFNYGVVDDILPPVSDCFCPPVPSAADTGGKEGLETSCDTAAAILVELHGKTDPVRARAALGCIGATSCSVKNTMIFSLMDELG